MFKKNIMLIVMACILSCNESGIDYKVAQQEVYDVPFKTQFSLKVLVKAGMKKGSLGILLNQLYDRAMNKEYKYHNPPTHIFIYIYYEIPGHTFEEYESDYQSQWVAMLSKINGGEKRIDFNDNSILNP